MRVAYVVTFISSNANMNIIIIIIVMLFMISYTVHYVVS